MVLQRIATVVREQHWGSLTIEFAVVVLGIFLGLQADDWNESRRERVTEAAYLQELAEDFRLNLQSLHDRASALDASIAGMITLLEQSSLPTPSLSSRDLNESFRLILSMPSFIAVDRAWSNLSGSGELKLLRDRGLRNALARYYAKADLSRVIQNTHEMQLVHLFQSYIIDEMDYAAVVLLRANDVVLPPAHESERITEVLSTRRFRNVVTLKVEICSDLLEQNRMLTALTEEILGMLPAEASAE